MAERLRILGALPKSTKNGEMLRSRVVKEGGYQPTRSPGRFPASLVRDDDDRGSVGGVPQGGHVLGAPAPGVEQGVVQIRHDILRMLSEREASPAGLARELGKPLNQTAYHVSVLKDRGWVEQVRLEPRRGGVEHFYRTRVEALSPLLERLAPGELAELPDNLAESPDNLAESPDNLAE